MKGVKKKMSTEIKKGFRKEERSVVEQVADNIFYRIAVLFNNMFYRYRVDSKKEMEKAKETFGFGKNF